MTTRTRTAALLAAAASLALAACGGGDAAEDTTPAEDGGVAGEQSVQVELEELRGSGVAGIATLAQEAGGLVLVTTELEGSDAGTPTLPDPAAPADDGLVLALADGSCDEPGTTVQLVAEVVDGRADGTLERTLGELDGHALVVHRSEGPAETDGGEVLACGEIPATGGPPAGTETGPDDDY